MELPAEKPRMMPGVMSPDNVLEAVTAGVDIFDSTYPSHLTLDQPNLWSAAVFMVFYVK